jgi:hypothetical protein
MKPCDPDIYENGTTVAVVADRDANGIEQLVWHIAYTTGQRVDWFYMAGRGVVRAIGDLALVRDTFRPYCNGWLKVVEEDETWTQ